MKHFSEGNQEEHEYDHNMSASKHVSEDRAYVVVESMFTPEEIISLNEERNKPGGNPFIAVQEIDYKSMLQRYINHVVDVEGDDFMSHLMTQEEVNEYKYTRTDQSFTDKEIKELNRMSGIRN